MKYSVQIRDNFKISLNRNLLKLMKIRSHLKIGQNSTILFSQRFRIAKIYHNKNGNFRITVSTLKPRHLQNLEFLVSAFH